MTTEAQELIQLGNAIIAAVENKTILSYDDAKLFNKWFWQPVTTKSSLIEPDKWWARMWETSKFKSILPEKPDVYYSTHK